jgi:hypothetical protein
MTDPTSPNGYLTANELTTVDSGVFSGRAWTAELFNPVANAFERARVAAGSIGLRVAPPDGAYRSYHVQQDMRNQFDGLPHDYDHNLSSASTARPAPAGTSSHGLGICVDIATTAQNNWMINNGGLFGFSRPLSNDPNHWQHDKVTAIAPFQEEDDDMKHLALVSTPTDPETGAGGGPHTYLQNLADHTYYHVPNSAQITYLKALGVRFFENQSPAVLQGFKKI